MSEVLDPEVAAALDRAGLCVRAFRRISKIQHPDTGRSVYRLELRSGDTIKARRLPDEETARGLFEIRRELPDAFAPALGQYGTVLLEEWIDGEVLGDGLPSDGRLTEAAALLARLHATPVVAGCAVHDRRSTATWCEDTEARLQQVLAAGAIEGREGALIRAALERGDPGQAIFGLVHLDFCGENMVIDRAGRLRVVDNERVRVGPLGFDVARTWYRWALPATAWEHVRSAYAARMPFAEPLDSFGFWAVAAVVRSAALRLRMDPGRARVPLDRLHRMAAEVGDQRRSC
jgi:aminoglycoside phosphotransferase (APT) family kinase protein